MKNRKDLHRKFVKLGRERSRITHELLTLLPEIHEKEIYKDWGCSSIYEYAAKFGDGLSPRVVDKVIKVKKDLEKCPELFATIKTQGVHKVAIISKLATPENEQQLVDVVENMSKPAVQEYSKKVRGKTPRTTTKIELDDEMEQLFLKLKKKLNKSTNKETMKSLLQAMHDQLFPGEKSRKTKKQTKVTRYVQKNKKREVHNQTNGICHHQNCNRPIDHLHHPDGYSKNKSHKNLTGLCKIHHEFAHNGIEKPLDQTDLLYRQHRKRALQT